MSHFINTTDRSSPIIVFKDRGEMSKAYRRLRKSYHATMPYAEFLIAMSVSNISDAKTILPIGGSVEIDTEALTRFVYGHGLYYYDIPHYWMLGRIMWHPNNSSKEENSMLQPAKRYCDICGKEIDRNDQYYHVVIPEALSYLCEYDTTIQDVCHDCILRLAQTKVETSKKFEFKAPAKPQLNSSL